MMQSQPGSVPGWGRGGPHCPTVNTGREGGQPAYTSAVLMRYRNRLSYNFKSKKKKNKLNLKAEIAILLFIQKLFSTMVFSLMTADDQAFIIVKFCYDPQAKHGISKQKGSWHQLYHTLVL